ncbi:uncharacterized protein isoform X2 [Choristoneura fumiferana]
MTFCAVPGCNSTTSDSSTNYTFHLVPSSLILRAQWVLALGPLRDDSYVCSRHFDETMFMSRDMKKLAPNAVPMQPLNKEPSINRRECFAEESCGEPSDELVACRACLAADGRLYAISGSGLEDTLAALTGAALPADDSFPRHLCVFCMARLSKCATFRDSCRRSTVLLRTLLEKGTLKMNDVKAIDRNSHELTYNLACNKVFEFSTDPLLPVSPEIKTENDEGPHEVTAFVDVECKGRKDSIKNDVDPHSFEVPIEKHEVTEVKLVKLKTENSNAHSEAADYMDTEVKNDTSDYDTDSSEETLAAVKRGKRKRVKAEKENTGKNSKKCKSKSGKSKISKVTKAVDDVGDKAVEAPKKTRRLRKTVGVKTDTETAFEKKFNCKTKLLSKEEQKQEVEERKRNNKSAYSCELCGKGFKKENTLMTHKSYHDPSLPAECDVCRLRFRSRRSLLKHQDCHRATFTCNECGNVSRNRSHAKDHCLMHKGTTYTCPYCQIVYNHQTSYYNHIRVQHPGENEACDECGETFAAGRGMMLHKALTHKQNVKPNVDTKCKDCDVKFSSGEALQRHLELSAGAGVPHAALWPCAACGDSCGSDTALKHHTAEQHPPEQRYCQECNKTFSNAASFALHVDRKHRNQRAVEAPFRPRPGIGRVRSTVCEICGKVYQNLTMLQYHMNGHLSVKPFQCPHCPKAFTHQSNHRLHMRVHTGERPYQCEQCPLAFSRRGNFTKHMKNVHLRVQVKCDTCGKMVGAGSLASHVRAVHLRQPYVRRKRNRNPEKMLLGTQS